MSELTFDGLLFYAVWGWLLLSVYAVVEWLLERRDKRKDRW